jgi:hypothetical protein
MPPPPATKSVFSASFGPLGQAALGGLDFDLDMYEANVGGAPRILMSNVDTAAPRVKVSAPFSNALRAYLYLATSSAT